MSDQVKIQVPIDREVRDKLQKRAENLGFDSIQAYIRVWAKAEVDGRELDFDDWGTPSIGAQKRWDRQLKQHELNRKAGKVRSYGDVDDFLKDLIHDQTDRT